MGSMKTREEKVIDDDEHFWGMVFSFWTGLALLWWILATEFCM
jgi:hypothetical protein